MRTYIQNIVILKPNLGLLITNKLCNASVRLNCSFKKKTPAIWGLKQVTYLVNNYRIDFDRPINFKIVSLASNFTTCSTGYEMWKECLRKSMYQCCYRFSEGKILRRKGQVYHSALLSTSQHWRKAMGKQNHAWNAWWPLIYFKALGNI